MFEPNQEITKRIVKTLEQHPILTTREIARIADTTRITAKKHLMRLVRDERASMFRIGHSDAWTMNGIPATGAELGGSTPAAGAQHTPNGVVADA